MRRTVFGWGPAAVWAGVLFLLSAWEEPSGLSVLELPDELLHLAVFTVLGAALGWARQYRHPEVAPWPFWILGWVYAASDEWHQSFVPGRTPALDDWLADVVGVVLGFGVVLWLWRRFHDARDENETAPGGRESIDRAK